jgi:threonine/homoserine/homoserine lactone efflux protein
MFAPADLLAAGVFACVCFLAPGPQPLRLAAIAATGGLRAAWPMMIGTGLGFASMLSALGLGLAWPLQASGQFRSLLAMAGFFWIVWLAFRIAIAPPPPEPAPAPPPGVLAAVAAQWSTPKAWLLAVAALGAFLPAEAEVMGASLVLALLFAAVSLPCLLLWALGGGAARRLLSSPRGFRAASVALGVLLAASVLPLPR